MRFRVYYGDGSTHSADNPYYVPATNVICIAVERPAGFEGANIVQGKDYYCWRSDEGWFGCDIGGLFDYLMLWHEPRAVLFGRTVRNEWYYDTIRRALKEGIGENLS